MAIFLRYIDQNVKSLNYVCKCCCPNFLFGNKTRACVLNSHFFKRVFVK